MVKFDFSEVLKAKRRGSVKGDVEELTLLLVSSTDGPRPWRDSILAILESISLLLGGDNERRSSKIFLASSKVLDQQEY